MKYLIIIMILSLSLEASEIDRMETIVEDIEKLREDYSKCKKELDKQTVYNIVPRAHPKNNDREEIVEQDKIIQNYKKRLDRQIFRNTILLAEIDSLRKLNKDKNIDKPTNKLNNILKIKEKEIISLKNKIVKLNKDKEKYKNSLILTKKEPLECLEDNKFPKLIMKEKVKARPEVEKEMPVVTNEVKIKIKPSTFRLTIDSDIYNSINGKVVYNWRKGISFTSNLTTQNWIKVTGNFNTGKWSRTKEVLWVKKENTTKR